MERKRRRKNYVKSANFEESKELTEMDKDEIDKNCGYEIGNRTDKDNGDNIQKRDIEKDQITLYNTPPISSLPLPSSPSPPPPLPLSTSTQIKQKTPLLRPSLPLPFSSLPPPISSSLPPSSSPPPSFIPSLPPISSSLPLPISSQYFQIEQSPFFPPPPPPLPSLPISTQYLQIEKKLCQKLINFNYGDAVQYIYNPIEYASEIHEDFVRKYCTSRKTVLLLGMNPGPWGMGQTGVPFGHVGYAKDWLGVRGDVKRPPYEHPKRPVLGLDCTRKEVSGERMWSLLKELSEGSPEVLFRRVFIHNYCPLFFLKGSAKNVTPPELKAKERSGLEEACDVALVDVVRLLGVERVVGVGKYATDRTKAALRQAGIDNIQVSTLMHPSPVNPAANKGWREIAIRQLTQENVIHFFQPYERVT